MSETYMQVHVEAWHARVIIFNFPMKMKWFGPIETKLIHFHRISKNVGGGGGGGGSEGVRVNPLNPN